MVKYDTINYYLVEANKPPETTLILEHGEDGSTAVPVDPEEDREAWTPWEVSLQGCHSISCIGGCIRLYPLAVLAVAAGREEDAALGQDSVELIFVCRLEYICEGSYKISWGVLFYFPGVDISNFPHHKYLLAPP